MKFKCFLIAALSAACLLAGCSQTAPQMTEAPANNAQASAVTLISDIATTQYFTDEAVSDKDLDTILMAGINAPSAMNGQPWHFTAITDAAVLEQIAGDMSFGGMPPAGMMPPDDAMPEGAFPGDMNLELPKGAESPAAPPAAPVSGASKAGLTDAPLSIVVSCADGSELDAGLACQNMSVTAQLLGYGTKIISSPTIALNGANQAEYKTLLGIPENQTAVAILLVGWADTSVDESVDGYTGATARNPLNELVTYVKGS